MRAQEFITEVFEPETAFELEWDETFAPDELHATAYDRQGREINISFVPIGGDAIDIEFKRGGSFDVTGRGDAERVFGTVIHAVTTYLSKYRRPEYILFSGKETSRNKLYLRLVARYAAKYGYREIGVNDLPDELFSMALPQDVFILEKNKIKTTEFINEITNEAKPMAPLEVPTPAQDTVEKSVKTINQIDSIIDILNFKKSSIEQEIANLKDQIEALKYGPPPGSQTVKQNKGWVGRDKKGNPIAGGPINENFTNSIKFVEPNFDFEWEEAERYPEFVKLGKDAWIELARKGRAITINSAQDINNTDAADPDSFKLLAPEKQKRALAQLEKGTVEMPIVAVYSDGHKELIGGNTRLTAMMARDGRATVWAFQVPGKQGVAENFADGKIKGKSRPGRVKRSGASCSGSVSELRARAKKYGGEKGKMYHWCANMKGGRK